MPLLTQAEYAKRRGCTDAAVCTARKGRIKAAEVVMDGKVLIDSDLADRLWQQNSRPRRGSGRRPDTQKAERSRPSAAKQSDDYQAAGAQSAPLMQTVATVDRLPTDEQIRAYVDGLPEDQIPNIDESIKRKEHYAAERARVAALRDREEVVPVNNVRDEAFALARALRDGLMRVADRLAPTLAATTDARQVHYLLSEEIRVALRSLNDA